MPGTYRSEHGVHAFPGHTNPRQELLHRDVVGHEQPVAVDGNGEVPIPDFERNPNHLIAIPRRNREHRLRSRFDDDVVPIPDVEDMSRREHAPGGQRERKLPPFLRLDASASPSALFRREDESIALESGELLIPNMHMTLGDDGRCCAHCGRCQCPR